MPTVLHLNDQNFEKEVLQSEVPVLVDFHATWCGPCKNLAPIVEQLASEYQGRAKVGKLDIDEAPGIASTYGIMAVPTLILFKGGREQRKMTGFQGKPQLESALKSVL
jgi:thioredoxin 1